MEAKHPNISDLLKIVKDSESKVKARKSRPIPVPERWYNEMVDEMARRLMATISNPRRQFERISKLQQQGMDEETMSNGRKVNISTLQEFYSDSLKELEKLPDIAVKRIKFKQKYKPIKGLKGNIKAAINEAKLIKLNRPSITDYSYRLFHSISDANYLCEKEMDVLMDEMWKLGYF
jgi:hypothetical protein